MYGGHADYDDGDARVGEPRIKDKIDRERKENAAVRGSREVDPPNMPQVEREMNLLIGMMSGLESSVARLVAKLDLVMKPSIEEKSLDKVRRAEMDWPVSAPLATQMRELYGRMNDVAEILDTTTHRVEL